LDQHIGSEEFEQIHAQIPLSFLAAVSFGMSAIALGLVLSERAQVGRGSIILSYGGNVLQLDRRPVMLQKKRDEKCVGSSAEYRCRQSRQWTDDSQLGSST
jgi:hypothetical protein